MTAFKTSLSLEAMEARDVPAVIGWAMGGPQPEPPTVIGKAALVKIDPMPLPPSVVASPVVKLPADVGGKAGILFPVFKPAAVHPPAAPNAILFPVFVGK